MIPYNYTQSKCVRFCALCNVLYVPLREIPNFPFATHLLDTILQNLTQCCTVGSLLRTFAAPSNEAECATPPTFHPLYQYQCSLHLCLMHIRTRRRYFKGHIHSFKLDNINIILAKYC